MAAIVLDTCVLLNDLKDVQELAHLATQYGVEILLPRETIKELDRIKDKRKQETIGKSAQKVINWIGLALSKTDPDYKTVRGQKQHEAFKAQLSGDEAILDFAAWYQRASNKPTILVTEDHNLSNRAYIDGVESYRLSEFGPQAMVTLAYDRGVSQMCLDDEDDVFYESKDGKALSPASTYTVDTPSAELSHTHPNSNSHQLRLRHEHDSNPPIDFEPMVVEPACERAVDPQHRRELPPPIDDPAFGRRVMLNIAQLLDWHVHQIFSDSELVELNYAPPKSSPEFADVLKQFAVAFDAPVPSAIVTQFSEIAYQKHADKAFVSRHVDLLRRLSINDTRYRDILAISKSQP